jgi:hypothetical protein
MMLGITAFILYQPEARTNIMDARQQDEENLDP